MGLLESFGGIYGAQTLEMLQITVVLDAAQATMGLRELRDGVLEGGQEFGKYALAAGEIIGPLVAVGYAMWETAAAAAHFAHEISDLQIITGLSSKYLQELKYACDTNLISFDAVSTSVMFFQKHLGDLDSPTSQVSKALERLNIDARDANGQFRSMDSLFPEIISALKNVRDPTERAGLALELFGRNTKEIIKLVDLGSDGIAKFGAEAETLGIILGPDEQAKADAYAKELAKMNAEWEAMWRNVGVELIPIMQEAIPLFEEMLPTLKSLADFAVLAAMGFKQMADAINLAYNAFLAAQSFGQVGDVTGAYKQLAKDVETGSHIGETTPATTGSVTSKSKQLYAQLHGTKYGVQATPGVTVNVQAVQQTPDQMQNTIKAVAAGILPPLAFLV
jgi:hypothetical protein